jgi:hypothetical protein
MLRNSRVAAKLAASQEGLSCMELVQFYARAAKHENVSRGQDSAARVRKKSAQQPLPPFRVLEHMILWRYKNSLQVMKRAFWRCVGCDPMKLKRG